MLGGCASRERTSCWDIASEARCCSLRKGVAVLARINQKFCCPLLGSRCCSQTDQGGYNLVANPDKKEILASVNDIRYLIPSICGISCTSIKAQISMC